MPDLGERVAALEARIDANDERTRDAMERLRELRGAEEEHQSLDARITRLERHDTESEASTRSRRDRLWVLGLALVTGIVFPIVVTAVITFFHLKSYR